MAALNSPDDAGTELHRLILTAVPDDERGRKTVLNAAHQLGVTRATVWNWIKAQKISPERAKDIVEMGQGRVSLDQFHPFVYAS